MLTTASKLATPCELSFMSPIPYDRTDAATRAHREYTTSDHVGFSGITSNRANRKQKRREKRKRTAEISHNADKTSYPGRVLVSNPYVPPARSNTPLAGVIQPDHALMAKIL